MWSGQHPDRRRHRGRCRGLPLGAAASDLRITGVKVTATNQSVGCDGTADIIGTIYTNGHGGTIGYQWVENNVAKPRLMADDASGSNEVQIPLKWAFHGKGNGTAVAELRVLDPQQTETSIIIPYSC